MKITLIGVGGTGINITATVGNDVAELGDGFASVERLYVDTATSNIKNFFEEEPDTFYKIETEQASKSGISGSGMERRTNAADMQPALTKFIDKHKLNNRGIGEYTIVVFSGHGGTGSVAAPVLIKNLLERNIPTIGIMVGDSASTITAMNTLNTIASMQGIANLTKKPFNLIYVDNNAETKDGVMDSIKKANIHVFNTLCALSLFLSSDNFGIDDQDMVNIIDQSRFTTINIKPGLYSMSVFKKDVKLSENVIPIGGRTLTADGVSPDINVELDHHKFGVIRSNNAKKIYGGLAPLHLISYANFFTEEEANLKRKVETMRNRLNAVRIDQLSGTSDADENGLVL